MVDQLIIYSISSFKQDKFGESMAMTIQTKDSPQSARSLDPGTIES
jgi:hypothetical protein